MEEFSEKLSASNIDVAAAWQRQKLAYKRRLKRHLIGTFALVFAVSIGAVYARGPRRAWPATPQQARDYERLMAAERAFWNGVGQSIGYMGPLRYDPEKMEFFVPDDAAAPPPVKVTPAPEPPAAIPSEVSPEAPSDNKPRPS